MTIASHAITVLRRLLDGLLFALVAVSLGVIVLGRVVPLLGHPALVVAGPSMEPTIPIGAAVVLDQVPPSSLAVGDVVSLRSGSDRAIFTHRVTRLVQHEGTLWLESQGDANPAPDPSLTPATAVLGRVAVFIPVAGYLLTFYSAVSGILFVISFGLVLLFLGILLEPQVGRTQTGSDRPVEPLAGVVPAALAVPAATAATTVRPTAKEAALASRARRARRTGNAANWSPRSGTRA